MIKEENIRGPRGDSVKIEAFVHGALCVAISGKCYMSLAQYNVSGNRGSCLQACRRKYRVIEEETGKELVLDNNYIMSPKDLCTIGFLDQLMEAGISVFKIEGRGRSPEYVHTVTKTYREAVDSVLSGEYSQEKIRQWTEDLSRVYNRGFWHGGYYLGKPLGEWSGTHGSKATKKKTYVAKVTNYFAKKGVGEFFLEAHTLEEGNELLIMGPTTGVVSCKAESLFLHGESSILKRGGVFTIPVPEKIRRNDKCYVVTDR